MVSCPSCGAKPFIPADLEMFQTTPCPKCSHPLMVPFRLRQFELRAPIASGGNGTVYRAFDIVLEREVALKMIRSDLANDAKALDNFYREARACASLNHTNIIHIYSFDEWEGMRYLVMELADRGSLDGMIEKMQRVPELDVLDVGIKVAQALEAALKHNLLHSDIKPGNILFNSEVPPEPKLVDFGLARSAGDDARGEDAAYGTPYYVAPEKLTRQPETFLSDMYSLGGTLYHALTGHVPFEAPTIDDIALAHIQTPLTPPNQVVPEITQPTSDALVRAMAKSPADRFQSYAEFYTALEAARSQVLVAQYNQAYQGGDTERGQKWWRR
jgi:serine/threonine-protein kinase